MQIICIVGSCWCVSFLSVLYQHCNVGTRWFVSLPIFSLSIEPCVLVPVLIRVGGSMLLG